MRVGRGRRRSRRVRVAVAAFWLHVLLAPQLLGGLYPWAVVLSSTTSLAAMAAGFWALPSVRPTSAWRLLLGVFGFGLLWTGVQAAPLPCSLVELLHPDAYARATTTSQLIDRELACTLSLDPGQSRLEVLKGIGLMCTVVAASRLALSGYREQVLGAVGASTCTLALVGLGHYAIGATRVFGLYRPPDVISTVVLSPLMNPNHLGGFGALGVPLLLGQASGARSRQLMSLLLLFPVVMVIVVMLTMSRGAIAVTVVASAGLSVWSWRVGRGGRAFGGVARVLALWAASVIAFLAAGYLAFDAVVREYAAGDLFKFVAHGKMLQALPQQPLVGVGRGAFAVGYLVSSETPFRFAYAESLPLQWAFEWGVPATTVMLLALAWLLYDAARGARTATGRGGVMGLSALVVQNLADYNLELFGVATVAAACFAGLTPRPRRRTRRSAWMRPHFNWGAAAVASVGIVLLSTSVLGAAPHQARVRLRRLLETAEPGVFEAGLADALANHPSEPNLVVLGATQAVRRQRRDAFAWLNHAMSLAPRWGAPHALAAALLWNMGRQDQALLELREAGRLDWKTARDLLCSLVEQDATVLPKALPKGDNQLPLARSVQHCMDQGRLQVAAVDAWQRETLPELDRPFTREAERLARRGDHAGAIALLQTAVQADARREELWFRLAQHLLRAGQARVSLAATEQAERHLGPTSKLLQARARAQAKLGDGPGMRATVARLRASAGGKAGSLVATMVLLGDLEMELGNLPLALRAYRRAHGYGHEPDVLLKVAYVSEKLGDLPSALRAYSDVCRRRPDLKRGCDGKHRIEEMSKAVVDLP